MSVRIDCDTCLVRGLSCHDCVVTVLLGMPPELDLDADETRALAVLADGGLVPRCAWSRRWRAPPSSPPEGPHESD